MDSATLPPMQFKDRKSGLVLFGVLTVFMGGFCALLVPLMLIGLAAAAHSSNPPPPPAVNLTLVALMYGSIAVVLIWLGIGSIKARRWARALLAIGSWSWLIAGLMAAATMIVMAPKFASAIKAAQRPGQPELSGAAQSLVMLVPIVIFAFLFILLPLAWALFYSGRNVKATCEARDPVVRWTDRCPLPVLAASLWLFFGSLTMLAAPAFRAVAPFFGTILSGPAGVVFYLLFAVLWIYCAWGLYHLDRRAWWVTVAAMILMSVSNAITYSRHDLGEIYLKMGYSSERIAQMQSMGFVGNNTFVWATLVCIVPFLGYLLYIRKFFNDTRRPATNAQ